MQAQQLTVVSTVSTTSRHFQVTQQPWSVCCSGLYASLRDGILLFTPTEWVLPATRLEPPYGMLSLFGSQYSSLPDVFSLPIFQTYD